MSELAKIRISSKIPIAESKFPSALLIKWVFFSNPRSKINVHVRAAKC